jgi:carboxylate-amine ligase
VRTQRPLGRAFDTVSDLTVGAEEEVLLVDPETLEPAPAAQWVLAELGDSDAHRPELWAAQVELLSGVHSSADGVAADLSTARTQLVDVLGGRLRIAGLGTHPLAVPTRAFYAAERYAELTDRHALAASLGALAAGLHVHVAVAGADRALAVYNALRGYAPLFTALAANAPFVAARDSGLATVRPMLADVLPRQGVGPHLPAWTALEEFVDWGQRTGAIADPTQLWWECRLNLRLGTVELRSPDAQSSLADAHGLVAMAHALIIDLCDRFDNGDPLPAFATLRIQENRWRAMRFGIHAELIDLEHGRRVAVRELAAELLDQVAHHATPTGLGHARALAARDEPREQRQIAGQYGPRAIVARAADRTEGKTGLGLTADGYCRSA